STVEGSRAAALEHLGDLRALEDYARHAASAAKRRGDLVAYVSTLAGVGMARGAANDQPGLSQAIDEMHRVIDSWTVGYGLWHSSVWELEVIRALRAGDVERAEDLFERDWPRIEDAMLTRTRLLRLYLLEMKAAATLSRSSAQRKGSRSWLKATERLAAEMDEDGRLDALAFAQVLRAAAADFRGHASASEHLEAAASLYERAEMRERACVTRWRLAKLRDDEA